MRRDIVIKARKVLGDLGDKKIGILGLAFKPNTDDMRDAPAIDVISLLVNDGAKITAFDPVAMKNAKKILPDIEYAEEAYDALNDADLMIVLTDWNEFKELDFEEIKKKMKSPNIIDGRNIYDPQKLKELGFSYIGVGR